MKKKFFVVLLLISALLISAFAPFQELPTGEPVPFFEGFTSEQLIGMIIAVIFGITQGFFEGASVFTLLKNVTGWEDEAAHWAVTIICFLLSAVALFVTGEIGLDGLDLTLMNLIAIGTAIYAPSQLAYQRLKNK